MRKSGRRPPVPRTDGGIDPDIADIKLGPQPLADWQVEDNPKAESSFRPRASARGWRAGSRRHARSQPSPSTTSDCRYAAPAA